MSLPSEKQALRRLFYLVRSQLRLATKVYWQQMRVRIWALVVCIVLAAIAGRSAVVRDVLFDGWSHGITWLSGWVMHLFGSDVIQASMLCDPVSFKCITVAFACSGADACLILTLALWLYPSRWQATLIGIVVGLLAVQGINVLRIISLYYLNIWNSDAFDFAHLYLWQGLLMIDVLVFILLWLRWQHRYCLRHTPT